MKRVDTPALSPRGMYIADLQLNVKRSRVFERIWSVNIWLTVSHFCCVDNVARNELIFSRFSSLKQTQGRYTRSNHWRSFLWPWFFLINGLVNVRSESKSQRPASIHVPIDIQGVRLCCAIQYQNSYTSLILWQNGDEDPAQHIDGPIVFIVQTIWGPTRIAELLVPVHEDGQETIFPISSSLIHY